MHHLEDIAAILRYRGIQTRTNGKHGFGTNITFTGEYVCFGKNPNLYWFKQDSIAAAEFIASSISTLCWTDADWAESLECDKDELYFVCQLYKKIVEQTTVSIEEIRSIYFLFKEATESILDHYSKQYKLPHGGLNLQCAKAEGRCYRQSHLISLNTDLIMCNPNYIKSVILHELCHIAFPNHRQKFWALLQELLVDSRLTSVTDYVVSELFSHSKDHYILTPIIHGGPDMRFRKCLPHPNLFTKIKAIDK